MSCCILCSRSGIVTAEPCKAILPPRGLGLTLPVSSCRSVQRIADDTLTR
jgi:hypothetical protein